MADKPIYETEFYGMDRRLDADKLASGMSPFALNVELSRLGTVRKRKGTKIFGDVGVKYTLVQGLVEYNSSESNENQLHMVRNNILFNYSKENQLWSKLVELETKNAQVNLVNFNNRIYLTNHSLNLSFETGSSALTVVGSQDNRIKAKCLTSSQRTLFVGNVIFDDTLYSDRVYYSVFDLEKNSSSDQFWETEENGLKDSTRYFKVEGGSVTALVNFQSLLHIFTERQCYTFDVTKVETDRANALINLFDFGCINQNAVTVLDGVMYWMDRQCKIWAWTGNTLRPVELSYIIDDDGVGNSIISQINKSEENLNNITVFGNGRKLYFSIGDITLDSVVIQNAVIKLTLSQSGTRGYFSLDSFPERISSGITTNIDSENVLIGGSGCDVVMFDSGLNDETTEAIIPINSVYRTRSYTFDSPFNEKTINEIRIRFRPTEVTENYLTVKIACNNSLKFGAVSDPINNVVNHGKIDMYDQNSDIILHKFGNLLISQEKKFYSVAFEFSNSQLDQSFEISAFGFDKINFAKNNISIL